MRYRTTETIAAPPPSASVAVKMGVSPAGGKDSYIASQSDVTETHTGSCCTFLPTAPIREVR